MCIGALVYNWLQFLSFNASKHRALVLHTLMMMIGMCRVFQMSKSSKVLLFHSQPCGIICASNGSKEWYITSFISDVVIAFDINWKLFVYTLYRHNEDWAFWWSFINKHAHYSHTEDDAKQVSMPSLVRSNLNKARLDDYIYMPDGSYNHTEKFTMSGLLSIPSNIYPENTNSQTRNTRGL